jgi:hypothetical protein
MNRNHRLGMLQVFAVGLIWGLPLALVVAVGWLLLWWLL